jgi:hypothetical protein
MKKKLLSTRTSVFIAFAYFMPLLIMSGFSALSVSKWVGNAKQEHQVVKNAKFSKALTLDNKKPSQQFCDCPNGTRCSYGSTCISGSQNCVSNPCSPCTQQQCNPNN